MSKTFKIGMAAYFTAAAGMFGGGYAISADALKDQATISADYGRAALCEQKQKQGTLCSADELASTATRDANEDYKKLGDDLTGAGGLIAGFGFIVLIMGASAAPMSTRRSTAPAPGKKA